MCKYAVAQKISGAVCWVPKRSWPKDPPRLVNAAELLAVLSGQDELINDAKGAARTRLQRKLREWPWCPEGGEVELRWYLEGGRRTWHGYFKCSHCRDDYRRDWVDREKDHKHWSTMVRDRIYNRAVSRVEHEAAQFYRDGAPKESK